MVIGNANQTIYRRIITTNITTPRRRDLDVEREKRGADMWVL
jgi:hypothetical protein